MPTNKALRVFLITTFLLLMGCGERYSDFQECTLRETQKFQIADYVTNMERMAGDTTFGKMGEVQRRLKIGKISHNTPTRFNPTCRVQELHRRKCYAVLQSYSSKWFNSQR